MSLQTYEDAQRLIRGVLDVDALVVSQRWVGLDTLANVVDGIGRDLCEVVEEAKIRRGKARFFPASVEERNRIGALGPIAKSR